MRARKPAAKAAATKVAPKTAATKVAAKTAAAKAAAKAAAAKAAVAKAAHARRPDPNPLPGVDALDDITRKTHSLADILDNYAANLRVLDRLRHNSVGIKRLGFIEAALRIAGNFPEYHPHWLNTEKFQQDLGLYNSSLSLVEACRVLEEKALNINTKASDMAFTDALEYYSQVKDAFRRRIDSACALYEELHGFFKGMGPHETGNPTEKEIKQDVDALLHGRKDGEVIIRNVRPKTAGGKREVTDKTYEDRASFKETDEGGFRE
jgi:hypothetical protein